MTFGEFLNSNWKWFIPTFYILLHIFINIISFKVYDAFKNKTPQEHFFDTQISKKREFQQSSKPSSLIPVGINNIDKKEDKILK